MSNVKFLIDTNIFISLEDTTTPVPPIHALFHKKCSENLIQLCLHEASKDDIEKDREIIRKITSLSKIDKYVVLEHLPAITKEELETLYGTISNDNDFIDCKIFYAVDKLNAANFLVTEDIRLRKRAINHGLGDIVLSIQDAIDWINSSFSQKTVPLPQIEEKQCHQLPVDSPIYTSLQNDYSGFMNWFSSCRREHRDTWVIEENGHPQAIVILKDEPIYQAPVSLVGSGIQKILKVCTFKVGESLRGEKIGELYLKKLFWHANANKYDVVYLTAFEKQKELILLLNTFGFLEIGKNERGEAILAKFIKPDPTFSGPALEYHSRFYPNFRDDSSIKKFVIPIRPEFSKRLFPEKVMERQPLFFEEYHSSGNVIKKVYICGSKISKIRPGDILIFYNSKDNTFTCSQELISIGIAESINRVSTKEDLIRQTAKRTVYTEADFDAFLNDKKPLTAISFSLAKHIDDGLNLSFLKTNGVLNGQPQTILEISDIAYNKIKQAIR